MERTFRVLLVEDDANDVALLTRSFSKHYPLDYLHVVTNGIEAMAYLEGSGRFRDRARFAFPDILLLDLTLPGISGFEVLEWLRTQSDLQSLPCVVLTASSAIADAKKAYVLGANSFITKPVDADSLVNIFQAFLPRQLPPPPRPGPALQDNAL